GLVRSIGVSNFLPEYLDELIARTGVTPSVNQIEPHPYFNQAEQRAADKARGILTQAWTPIGKGTALLSEAPIVAAAQMHGRSPAQVILRWHTQLGVMPIPKSANADRRAENLDIDGFTLDDADMAAIATLNKANGRL